jgi:iron-sulfur cluster assembly protein
MIFIGFLRLGELMETIFNNVFLCSTSYTIEYVDEYTAEPGVTNFAQQDFVVLVDAKSLAYLTGLTMDWVRNGLNEGFDFINPNERDRCGCGESFRV